MPTIAGVGPDAPTEIKPNGAKQSDSPYRLDLIPPKALLNTAAILKQGAVKYGENNWRGLSVEDNLNHALVHIYAYLASDRQDDHLGHALCRMMFAKELEKPVENGHMKIKPCSYCDRTFNDGEPIHQFHGRNYHKSCLPPTDFPR